MVAGVDERGTRLEDLGPGGWGLSSVLPSHMIILDLHPRHSHSAEDPKVNTSSAGQGRRTQADMGDSPTCWATGCR